MEATGALRQYRAAGVALLLAGLAVSTNVPDAAAQGRPASVQVDPVSVVQLAETQPLIARLVAMAESLVATRVPGIVGAVNENVGDQVSLGDPLAVLDAELVTIEHDGAQATLLQAEAGLQAAVVDQELAEQIYQRTEGLRGSAAFSQGRFDDLAQELARARAQVAQAEAALAIARSSAASAAYNLANATIRAPFDGVVLARQASPGDYLQVGEGVVRLLDDTDLEIEADVPTEIVAALNPGEVVVTLSDGDALGQATVRAAVPSEATTTRTRPVRFAIDENPDDKALAPGQTVTVLAPVGQPRDTLSVAKDALVQRAGGWIVFKVEDGAAVPLPVTIGAAVEDRIEVDGALEPGDLVVVRGNERLRPGQPVAFEDPRTSVAVGSAAPAQAGGAADGSEGDGAENAAEAGAEEEGGEARTAQAPGGDTDGAAN